MKDVRILWKLARGMGKEGDHQERLESFYDGQADHYDSFREKMLHGREDLATLMVKGAGDRVLDIGGGTGRNLEFFADRIPQCDWVEVVDLCRPLLEVAERRIADHGWDNVSTTHGDATKFQPSHGTPNRIMFSYSLSMMPTWLDALEHCIDLLEPGGLLGVVDFYVSTADPGGDYVKHSKAARAFWPRWFRHSAVHLREELLPALESRLERVHLEERTGAMPYLLLKAPYLVYVGRKA